ncbi:hypothetical protein CMV_024385, partial [Castanea mollissima]
NLGNVEGLKKLDLSGTAIKELPSSIERGENWGSIHIPARHRNSRGNKRSSDEDDGAGPSGECCSIMEPPPKRIQRLGGFMEDSEDPSQREFFDFFAMDVED